MKRVAAMRTITRTLLVLLLGAGASTGCKNKAEEAQKAQETATKKTAEATEAQREADDKAAAARREADDKMVKERTDVRDKLRKDIDAADRKTASLREKLAKAKGDVQKNADAAANEVQIRHAKVDANMTKLSSATGAAWDSTKLELDADLAALDEAVDNFEKALK
jgi:membrane protein involved in colicin uptake